MNENRTKRVFFKNLDIAKTGSIRIELPRAISRTTVSKKKDEEKSTTENISRVKERMCQ